jgi:hypothetical protein
MGAESALAIICARRRAARYIEKMKRWKFVAAALTAIALAFTLARSPLRIGDERGSELPWVVGFGLLAVTRFDSPLGDYCFLAAGTMYYTAWALLAFATAAGRIRPRWLVLSIIAHWISAATSLTLWGPLPGLDFWIDDFDNGWQVDPPFFVAFWSIFLLFHLGVVACAAWSILHHHWQVTLRNETGTGPA